MSKPVAYLWIALLVCIHTLDMELTRHYIGNDWTREVFVPMSLCIKHIGIYQAVWVSRVLVYGFIIWFLRYRSSERAGQWFAVCTVLYWAAMVNWLDTLHLVSLPVR